MVARLQIPPDQVVRRDMDSKTHLTPHHRRRPPAGLSLGL